MRPPQLAASSFPTRRFPPPWTLDEHNDACFIVRDATGQALGYFYFEEEPALPRPTVAWTPINWSTT